MDLMAVLTRPLSEFSPAPGEIAQDLPPANYRIAPDSPAEMAELLAAATEDGAMVVPWGGGTHQGLGYRVFGEVLASTRRLDRIIAWEPDDLTVVVEAGVCVDELEAEISVRRQTSAFPETAPGATVGGVISAGISGYRRLRYGPSRDRILQATVATGDGRLVTAGGRVVKNVSGYDIQRSVFGALGSLGVVTSVCLKLWPRPLASATVATDSPADALSALYRPLAVLETDVGGSVYLEGPPAQVRADAARVGGEVTDGLVWPEPPRGEVGVALTVPPSDLSSAVERVRPLGPFVAQHGVGRVDVVGPFDTDWEGLRSWAVERGGRLTVTDASDRLLDRFDPWGDPPPALAVQRRLIAAFDPARTVNRGRLPGAL